MMPVPLKTGLSVPRHAIRHLPITDRRLAAFEEDAARIVDRLPRGARDDGMHMRRHEAPHSRSLEHGAHGRRAPEPRLDRLVPHEAREI
jgi:hypothetical protein